MPETARKNPAPENVSIHPGELLERVMYLKHAGYRLVQISCTKTDVYEMNYSFDLNYGFVNLKLAFPERIPLPSVTDIYPGAFLYENEINELFNLRIRGIGVDYKGTLYKTDIKHPFAPDVPPASPAAEGGKA